jgi:hypothetical protein
MKTNLFKSTLIAALLLLPAAGFAAETGSDGGSEAGSCDVSQCVTGMCCKDQTSIPWTQAPRQKDMCEVASAMGESCAPGSGAPSAPGDSSTHK